MKFTIDVLGIFLKVVVRINRVTFAPLVVSTLFILLTSLLAHCARRLVQKTVKEPFVKLLLEEAIAAAELCGAVNRAVPAVPRHRAQTLEGRRNDQTALLYYLNQYRILSDHLVSSN
ncbi:hypothetical protein ACJJTC_009730 [Scirpophaga incertulas]